MTEPARAMPEAGWYPESADSTGYRWWTGRDWSEHRQAQAPRPGALQQAPLPAGTSTSTWMNWTLVFIPLLSLPASIPLLVDLGSVMHQPASLSTTHAAPTGFIIAMGVQQLLGMLILAATVVLAFFDWRTLQRRGVTRPFHWAWSFLSVVYVVGRNIVVHSRTGRGLAPLWVFIAVYIVATLGFLALFGITFISIAESTRSTLG